MMIDSRKISINHENLDGNQVNDALFNAWLYLRQCDAGITITGAGADQANYRASQIEDVLLKNGVITIA